MEISSEQKTKFRTLKVWKDFRKKMIEASGKKCQCCGVKNGKLQIHHKYPNHYDDLTPEKFVVICSSCHRTIEQLYKRVHAKKKTLIREELWIALYGDFLPLE